MMDRIRRIPAAPIIVSAILLAGSIWYLGGTPESIPPATSEGNLRLLTWYASSRAPAGPVSTELAGAISDLKINVVALQGLTAEDDAQALADSLGPGWRFEAIPGPSTGYLAVLWGPRFKVASFNLLTTRSGDALAVRLRDHKGRFYQILSLQPGEKQNATDASAGLADVLEWCQAHPASLTLLAGPVDLQGHLSDMPTTAFIAVGDQTPTASRVYITPPTAKVVHAGVLEGVVSSGGENPPLVVEIAPSAASAG